MKHALLIAAASPVGRALDLALRNRGWQVTWSLRMADAVVARLVRAQVIVVDADIGGDFEALWTIARTIAIPVVVHAPVHGVAEPVFGLTAACLQIGAADPEAMVDAAEMLQHRGAEMPTVLPFRIGAGRLTKWTTKLRGPNHGPW